jgi:predicted Zn-dependent protease
LTEQLYWNGLPGIDDRALRGIVSHCLQEYPGERPRSFHEILVAVESILGVESDARPPRELAPAEKFERALSLCEIGRIDRALTVFNRLMVERPDDVALWKRIATVLELVNKNDFAQRIRERL